MHGLPEISVATSVSPASHTVMALSRAAVMEFCCSSVPAVLSLPQAVSETVALRAMAVASSVAAYLHFGFWFGNFFYIFTSLLVIPFTYWNEALLTDMGHTPPLRSLEWFGKKNPSLLFSGTLPSQHSSNCIFPLVYPTHSPPHTASSFFSTVFGVY